MHASAHTPTGQRNPFTARRGNFPLADSILPGWQLTAISTSLSCLVFTDARDAFHAVPVERVLHTPGFDTLSELDQQAARDWVAATETSTQA